MKNEKNKMMPDNLDNPLFFSEGGRACHFYSHYSLVHTYSVSNKMWPLDVGVVGNFKDHLVKWYIIVKSEKEFDKYLNRFISDPLMSDILEKFITKTRESMVEKLKVNYQELTNNELSAIAKEYYLQFETMLRVPATIRCIDRAIISHLKSRSNSLADSDVLVRLASITEKPSFTLKEEIDLLHLAIRLKNKKITPSSKEAAEQIKKIYDDYCWSVRGYYNEKEKTTSDYIAILNEMIEKQPEIVLADLNKKITLELEEKHRALATQGEEENLLIRIASEASYLKDYYKFSINKMIFYADPLFAEIAYRTGKKSDFIKDLYPQEAIALLNGKSINESKIKERTKHNIFVVIGGSFYEYTGQEAIQFESRYLATNLNTQDEFKGRVAAVGYGRGKAKIILSDKDFHKLEKGDVLVVVNTSPDFVPIMRRAAAIVSEEGGITAHVSVISRELNIPCIVGIPHITQLVKDGDLVEVDANKGVVKILKRANGKSNK